MHSNQAYGVPIGAYGAMTEYEPGSPPPPSAMYPSGTASRLGITNRPSGRAEGNLHTLRLVLAQLPVRYYLNSAYRAPAVNKAVGGAGGYCSRISGSSIFSTRCSYHTTGLAADVTPIGMSKQQLAKWFYDNRRRFPTLDQVIWYHDTSHVHIGLDPERARAYRGQAGGFMEAVKTKGDYEEWHPGMTPKLAAVAGGVSMGLGLLAVVGGGLLYLARR